MGEKAKVLEGYVNLTPKQQAFCNHYLLTGNGLQSAIAAGYSENGASVAANRLLNNATVASWLRSQQLQVAANVGVTRERVLAEYAKIAFVDLRKAYGEDGQLKPIDELDDETAGALAGIESEEAFDYLTGALKGTTKKIKVWDKRAALDSICKMEGYNTPDAIITHGKVETVVTFKRG